MNGAEQATKNWMLARLRTVRSGLQLVIAHVDDLGGELARDKISAKEAAYDLTVLEETPVHWLGHILTPVDDSVSETLAQWEADYAKKPPTAKPKERPYRTPEATEQAFFYVVRQNDPAQLEQWLAEHPRDARYLQQQLEKKCQLQS